jgi:DNA-binding response OmpR family regulator
MKVLIVEGDPDLAELWRRHLERRGADVRVAASQEAAIKELQADTMIDVIVLDLVLEPGSAFAVADYASYRLPDAKVIFVTKTSFFSDGSIFRHIPNAYAFVRAETPVDDLAALVEHYGLRH